MINNYLVTWRDAVGVKHSKGFISFVKAEVFASRLEYAGLFEVEVL